MHLPLFLRSLSYTIYGEKYKCFMFCVRVSEYVCVPLESFSDFTIFIYIFQNAFVCFSAQTQIAFWWWRFTPPPPLAPPALTLIPSIYQSLFGCHFGRFGRNLHCMCAVRCIAYPAGWHLILSRAHGNGPSVPNVHSDCSVWLLLTENQMAEAYTFPTFRRFLDVCVCVCAFFFCFVENSHTASRKACIAYAFRT